MVGVIQSFPPLLVGLRGDFDSAQIERVGEILIVVTKQKRSDSEKRKNRETEKDVTPSFTKCLRKIFGEKLPDEI